MQINKISSNKIIFIDIETVPQFGNWEELTERKKNLWAKKTHFQREKNEISPEDFYLTQAGILAEFGKIVCISCGIITQNNLFRVKSFFGDDEHKILTDFNHLLQTKFNDFGFLLCAHNGKEFDFPYIARRMIINQIELPKILDLFGKKPWEISHLDTLELWKFGDFKHYTSLDLLAEVLGIPTPKDEIDGSIVSTVYYTEKNIEKIKIYCEKDLLTLAQVFRRFRLESPLTIE